MGDALQIGYSYTVAGHKVFLTEAMVSVVSLAMVGTLFLFLKGILHKLQTIFALILFIGIVIIGIICLPKALATGALTNGPVFGTAGLNPFYGIFSLVILAPWAFVGFDVACFETYRFNFSPTKTKWIIAIAIILAAISYISIALVGVAVVPEGFSSWSDYVSKLCLQNRHATRGRFRARFLRGKRDYGTLWPCGPGNHCRCRHLDRAYRRLPRHRAHPFHHGRRPYPF